MASIRGVLRYTLPQARAVVVCSQPHSIHSRPTGTLNALKRRRFSTVINEDLEDKLRAKAEDALIPRPTTQQYLKLWLVNAIPFIGFGFADNLIMIVAGDAIDQSLGITLGISTLAAAGLGNLLSDVVGIGAGDMIERFCHRMGLREPPLTTAQHGLKATSRVKTLASVIGISIGCIIGMFPLLFMSDRKALYFNDKELALYQAVFQPYGVSPHQFFDLLHVAQWKTVENGHQIVKSGSRMDRVILVHTGEAEAWAVKDDGTRGERLYTYQGRSKPISNDMVSTGASPFQTTRRYLTKQTSSDTPEATEKVERSDQDRQDYHVRGSIIGGSALVDIDVIRNPYPNQVVARGQVELLEWSIVELKERMKEDKSVEAAVFSTLYLDLVEGLKRRKATQGNTQRLGTIDRDLKDRSMHEFGILIKAVLSDEMVHPSERRMVREFMASNDITQDDLLTLLVENGWSKEEWEQGAKLSTNAIQDKIRNIPSMLRAANIRSRITDHDPGESRK